MANETLKEKYKDDPELQGVFHRYDLIAEQMDKVEKAVQIALGVSEHFIIPFTAAQLVCFAFVSLELAHEANIGTEQYTELLNEKLKKYEEVSDLKPHIKLTT